MTRYRRIVVHAGLSKTGSTSLQHNSSRHRQWLAQRGIIYPAVAHAGEVFVNHAIPLAVCLSAQPQRHVPELARRDAPELEALVRDCRAQLDAVLQQPRGEVLLLSAEWLEWLPPPQWGALLARLQAHGESVEVVAWFRSPQSGLESLLAERLKAGAVLEPQQLLGRVRDKWCQLNAGCGASLRAFSYHEAVAQEQGVVGALWRWLGLSAREIAGVELVRGNLRMSRESFRLMRAINLRYPKRRQEQHGVPRAPQDLNALLQLPGEPFSLAGFADSALYQACLAEAAWLEPRLGFRFPRAMPAEAGPEWQDGTLAALPGALQALPAQELRLAAAEWLCEEAAQLEPARAATAATLRAIAGQVLGAAARAGRNIKPAARGHQSPAPDRNRGR